MKQTLLNKDIVDKINVDEVLSLEDTFYIPFEEELQKSNGKSRYEWMTKKGKLVEGMKAQDFQEACRIFGEERAAKIAAADVNLRIANYMGPLYVALSDDKLQLILSSSFHNGAFEVLEYYWENHPKEFQKVESSIAETFERFEGARRVITARKLLQKHVLADNWLEFREDALENRKLSEYQLRGLESAWRISINPAEIKNIRDPFGDQNVKIEVLIGRKEYMRWKALEKYLIGRRDLVEWWVNEPFSLENESLKFGLDVTTILQVGDALQFGHNGWSHLRKSNDRIDSEYANLLNIVLNEKGMLPWPESAERIWLARLPEDLYRQRFQEISRYIWTSEEPKKGSVKVESFPKSKNVLLEHLNHKLVNSQDSHLWFELLRSLCNDHEHIDLEGFLRKMKVWKAPYYKFHSQIHLTDDEKSALVAWLTKIPRYNPASKSNVRSLARIKHIFPSIF
ncbi:uncharacterized protein PGTG_01667 [Puccinia graminis f. sp. tritici CRL 75-36-700-3]|uniref:Uncharacterized protein n=2 Tax=Puccinia graminis f. sp. tritici TaxID=56615 RepID=E3JSP9_PUCGT|nr:uncharacterized protein PGTG_01667 [Puccinia graminis f. sp. tritici CRL 75-36-700-3]EFP75074.1 hypothetical protein PGTG_01667 [Puccinia graminis f. sp. tritici CRL 75-36-700-3]